MSFLSRASLMGRSLSRRNGSLQLPKLYQRKFDAEYKALRDRGQKAKLVTLDNDVNFDDFIEALGEDEVNKLRKEFEAYEYTDHSVKLEGLLEATSERDAQALAEMEESHETQKEFADQASKDLLDLQCNRTTEETTLGEILRKNVLFSVENTGKINADQWDIEFKEEDEHQENIKSVTETWDEATRGAITDEGVLEVVSQMNELSENPVPNVWKMTPAVRKIIDEEFAASGAVPDYDELAKYAEANKLTDVDRESLTDEGDIWHAYVDAEKKGQRQRMKELSKHRDELLASNTLVKNNEWRAAQRENPPVRTRLHLIPKSKLESLSAEDLFKHSVASDNRWEADQFLYEAELRQGLIDPDEVDIETHSGLANLYNDERIYEAKRTAEEASQPAWHEVTIV